MAGVAGALFVPIVGIISPADVGVVPSIAFIIGVAVGGRNTLAGPVLGAIVVAYAQTTLSEQFPAFWIYFQGAIFILVVAFLPGGIASRSGRDQTAAISPCVVASHPTRSAAGLLRRGQATRAGRRRGHRTEGEHLMQADYLEVRGLTVSFDGFKAVDGVDLTVFQSDLRFLIGPNGAGKTTIIDALTGLVSATGSAHYGKVELIGRKSHQIARLGVGRTFQTASVFTELTVLQNLDIASGAKRSPLALLGVRRGIPDIVQEALETVALTEAVHKPAGVLSHGQKQWLEIGMLLVQNSQVMLLDEPVAGMSADERDATGELLKRIGADRTVIIVEHDMDFMRKWADSVTVLHQGKVLSEGSVAEVQADAKVQEVYLGRAHSTGEAAEVEAEVLSLLTEEVKSDA